MPHVIVVRLQVHKIDGVFLTAEASVGLTVHRVRHTPSRFPGKHFYEPFDNTTLRFIPSACSARVSVSPILVKSKAYPSLIPDQDFSYFGGQHTSLYSKAYVCDEHGDNPALLPSVCHT